MYNKRRNNLSKYKIASLFIIIIILITISLNFNRKTTKIEILFKDAATLINKIIMYPFTSLNKEKNVSHDESYLIQKNINESLEKEIEELKQTLELNKTLTEYDIENATILSRNKSYWFNTMIIDKGKKDGIKKDMAVITSAGLIGKISKV